MPSSPPPYNNSRQGLQADENIDGDVCEEVEEKRQEIRRPPQMKYKLNQPTDSDFSVDLSRSSTFRPAPARGQLPSDVPSSPESSVIQHQDGVGRAVSGQSDARNEELSPIYITRKNNTDGRVSRGSRELQASELQKRLERIQEERPLPSIEVQLDNSEVQEGDMTQETDDFAHNGNFVNVRRGGYSQEGSFQHRVLSASSYPPIDESTMLREESVQASTPKELPNIKKTRSSKEHEEASASDVSQAEPLTPHQSPTKTAQKEQKSSSGSPLKLFGTYDTFTNQKLLRRLSQFEGTLEDKEENGTSRSGLESSRPELNEAFVAASSPEKISKMGSERESTNRKYNSFGEGELDSFQFSEGISYNSERYGSAEDDKENMSLPLLNPSSHPSFRFQLEPSPALEENLVVHRQTKYTSVAKQVVSVRGGHRQRTSSSGSVVNLPTSQGREDLQTPRKRNGDSEGKRLPKTPLRDPTPKRRRTLHESDISFEEERHEETEPNSLRETHQQMQSVIGRKRKDARHGDNQEAANPSVLAIRHMLRPRTPSQNQRNLQQERQPLSEIDIDPEERVRILQQQRIAKIQAELDSTDPLKMSAVLSMSQQMQNDSRKGSVTTQDFLDEAKKIMAGIRGKARPQSGLTSVEESESENDRNQSRASGTQDGEPEDSYQESTQEPFSRPPSREGKPLARLPVKQEDPALLNHLRKYQEMSDMDAIAISSTRSTELPPEWSRPIETLDRIEALLRKRESLLLNLDNSTESDPPNIRISENPEMVKKRKHSASSTPASEDNVAADFPSHSSSGQSTARSIPTGSSRGSESKRVIAPHTVSHLIPEQLAGMVFDRERNIWVKRRSINGDGKGQNFLPSDDTEDDPFGDIPDLSVDETQELLRIKAAKKKEDAKFAQEQADENQKRTSAMGSLHSQGPEKAKRNISPTVVEAPSSPDPSKLTQLTSNGTTSSGINTRATSWEDSDALPRKSVAHTSEFKLHKPKRTENREEVVEEVEREISIHEDRITETPQRRRNVTITFSSPLESVISPVKYDNESSIQADAGAVNASFNGHAEDSGNGSIIMGKKSSSTKSSSLKMRSALRNSSRRISVAGQAFSGRPVSRIEEHDEESYHSPSKQQNERSISIVVSTPVPAPPVREANLTVATPRPAHEIGTLTLTPMSDFTMHQADEPLGLDVSYVAGAQRYTMGTTQKKTLSLSIRKLIEKLTEVEPFEPHWSNMKELDLSSKGLLNLHKLEEFCEELEDLNVSRNSIFQLEGVPHTVRNIRATHNYLSDLTPFGHLRNLQYIDVSNNSLESLSAFRSLVHLRGLRADNNKIKSLDGVSQLDGLLSLRLRGNSIRKLDFAGTKLQRLSDLDLKDNHINSVAHLEELRSLTILNLDDNHLSELSIGESETLWSLKYLKLSGNGLESVDVSKYPNLRLLYLDRNRLGNITGLLKTKHLDSLSMREQQSDCIINPSFISEAFEVRKLFLSGNMLGTFQPRADFLNLQYLELANCGLESLPIEFGSLIANTRVLNLNYNALTNIKPLEGIVRLKKLYLAGNRLPEPTSISEVLSRFPGLTIADLRNNPCTLGFYSPVLETRMMAAEDEPDPTEPYCLGQRDVVKDVKYAECLDMRTRMLRRVYEMLMSRTCRHLKMLDGLNVDRKAAERRDKVWDALLKAGFLTMREDVADDQEEKSGNREEVKKQQKRVDKPVEEERWQAEDSFA
jgi:Leucine-rich repeat (LRR) protein